MTKHAPCVAEMVGTFALIFAGAGAVSAQAWSLGAVSLVGIALAHGLVLCGVIYALGPISGAHVNPAVTISMVVAKKMEIGTGVQYIIAQLIGATVAAFALRAIFRGLPNNLGATDLAGGVSTCSGFILEAIITFLLVTSIFGAAVDERASKGFAGLAIGLTLAACILVGGVVTSASMNPARSFGPALASGHWDNHWLYWAGPITGGIAAGLLSQVVFQKKQ